MSINKNLGRGLGALLSDNENFMDTFDSDIKMADNTTVSETSTNTAINLPVVDIIRNPEQPRKVFDEVALDELVNSIRLHGVITPIIVVKRDDKYMIIAGERRWRAARKAGISTIPALVRNYTTLQIKEISLIDNLQREDLNPIETAHAIKMLMHEYNYTQEAVAERIGKSRSAVANSLGLLTLAAGVVDLISNDRLSAGHAKILTAIDDRKLQLELAMKAADGKMSVRKFEQLIKQVKSPKNASEKSVGLSLELKDLIQSMQRAFATKVSAIGNDSKGRIYIDYYSRDDLDRLVELIGILQKQHPIT